MTFFLAFFFVFGTIIGSFLNVVVLRYGTKTLGGRSHCFSCGKTLRWYELVPVFSFVLQKGRCRKCKAHISWQYPFVELTTGLVFTLIAYKESSFFLSSYLSSPFLPSTFYFLLTLSLWSLLIALSVYDLKHKIIPDALVYSCATLSFFLFLFSYFPPERLEPFSRAGILPARTTGILPDFVVQAGVQSGGHTSYFSDLWSGPLFALPIALIWFFSRGRAMGLGDAKLVVMFPWLVGLSRGLSAVIIGFWLGALVSLSGLFLNTLFPYLPKKILPSLRRKLKGIGMKTELPLGPFLVLGLFLVYIFGWDVTGLGMLLSG